MKQVILVKFARENSQKEDFNGYAYFADSEDNIKEGDFVVVFSRNTFKVAKVVLSRGLTANQRSKASKWIVQKVDIEQHEKRIKQEEITQEIKNALQEEKERMEDIFIYEKLAKDNPRIAALLEELKDVESGKSTKLLSLKG